MFLASKYNRIIISSLMIVLSFLMVAQVGLAVIEDTSGLNKTAQEGYGKNITSQDSNLSSIIGKIVGVALSFLGIFFFILIIVGGYMWMSSLGNEQTAGKAKDIILAAVIGLFIVLIAYAGTQLIAEIFT